MLMVLVTVVGSCDSGVGDGVHLLGLGVDAGGAGNGGWKQSRGGGKGSSDTGAGDVVEGLVVTSHHHCQCWLGVTQLSMLLLLVPAVVINAGAGGGSWPLMLGMVVQCGHQC